MAVPKGWGERVNERVAKATEKPKKAKAKPKPKK